MGEKKAAKKAEAITTKTAKPLGRPPFYSTPEQMQKKIDDYFATKVGYKTLKDTDGNVVYNKDGTPVMKLQAPTISGLCLHLGFSHIQALDDYEKKPNFSLTIKTAKTLIFSFAENELFSNPKPTGAIFWMKNNGWKAEETIVSTQTVTIKDDWRKIAEDLGISNAG